MKQFNKIDCQESSAEKHRIFEHNGIYRDTWLGKDERFQAKENGSVERKTNESLFAIRQRNTQSWK